MTSRMVYIDTEWSSAAWMLALEYIVTGHTSTFKRSSLGSSVHDSSWYSHITPPPSRKYSVSEVHPHTHLLPSFSVFKDWRDARPVSLCRVSITWPIPEHYLPTISVFKDRVVVGGVCACVCASSCCVLFLARTGRREGREGPMFWKLSYFVEKVRSLHIGTVGDRGRMVDMIQERYK